MTFLELAQHGLSVVGIILFCILWWLHLISIIYVRWYLHRGARLNLPLRYVEGVSLLKPLKGTDPNLASNLETFFTLDYEQYEVLLCVQDADDPAIDVCKSLLEKYPDVDAKLCIGGRRVGMNPKINNMMPGYEAAKYKLIWICDSRIRVKADTLTDLTNHMTDKVGMVHGLPYVHADRQGFAASLEQVYFGTCFTRLFISAHVMGFTCVAGMSCLMRKEILDQAGGLEAFAQYMGEDYIMAKAIAHRGWKNALATQVAVQNCGSCSFRQFQSRMIRWTKIRINTVPNTAVEPMSDCFVASLIIACAAHNLFAWNIVAFFVCHCLAWFITDYIQLSGVHGGEVHISKRKYAVAWFFRESLALPFFLLALWSRATITWRETRYRVFCGGTVEELPDVRERETSEVQRGHRCKGQPVF